MKQYIFTTLFVTLFINLMSCSDNPQLTKEQLLRQSIAQLEARFEERKLGRIIEYVSENYHDESGRGLKDIKRAIQLQLMRHKTLYVFSTINTINWIDDNNADVQITAAMAGKPIKSASLLTSIRADMIKFNVHFVLEDEIYKVQSATWTWADSSDFL
jgi:hypothetical protein